MPKCGNICWVHKVGSNLDSEIVSQSTGPSLTLLNLSETHQLPHLDSLIDNNSAINELGALNNVGPTLYKCYTNVLCVLGIRLI